MKVQAVVAERQTQAGESTGAALKPQEVDPEEEATMPDKLKA